MADDSPRRPYERPKIERSEAIAGPLIGIFDAVTSGAPDT
jgi:hypothetical protein